MAGDWFGGFLPADDRMGDLTVCVLSLQHTWSGRIRGTILCPRDGTRQEETVAGWAFGRWFRFQTVTGPTVHYRGHAEGDRLVLGTWHIEGVPGRNGGRPAPQAAFVAVSDARLRSTFVPDWRPDIPPSIDPPPRSPRLPQDPDVVRCERARVRGSASASASAEA